MITTFNIEIITMSYMRASLCGLLALVVLVSDARAETASADKEPLHIPTEFFPVRLDNSRPTGVKAGGKWHWVVTTCERHGWGRMLSSTLLSGVGANLDLASMSLSWCHTHTESLPSLLYNLRHHPFINVLLMSKALQDQAPQNPTHRLIFTWLSIPFMLGAPDLPLILTEDDILWSPTANQQLLQAIANMEKVVAHKDEPYLLSLYAPGTVPKNLNDNTTSVEIYQPEKEALTSEEMRLQAFYHFGSQGFFFSPGMTQNIEEVMLKVMYNSTESWDIDGGQDMIIKRLVEIRWKCMEKGSGCYFYSTRPSVLQHLGTSSATFNNNGLNTRFHGATDFPVKVKWSGFDDVEIWK